MYVDECKNLALSISLIGLLLNQVYYRLSFEINSVSTGNVYHLLKIISIYSLLFI